MTTDSPAVTINSVPPRTLRAMADQPVAPPPLDKSALIVIDAQQTYVDGIVALPAIQDALDQISALLHAAREQDRPIIHIAHVGQPGSPFDPETGGRIIERVKPTRGELVINKTLPNSFAGTKLEQELDRLKRPNLILCGFMTHMCVSSTARAALDLGYTTTVVGDACATRPLPNPIPGPTIQDSHGAISPVISDTVLHEASLAALADRFSFVVRAKEIAGDG